MKLTPLKTYTVHYPDKGEVDLNQLLLRHRPRRWKTSGAALVLLSALATVPLAGCTLPTPPQTLAPEEMPTQDSPRKMNMAPIFGDSESPRTQDDLWPDDIPATQDDIWLDGALPFMQNDIFPGDTPQGGIWQPAQDETPPNIQNLAWMGTQDGAQQGQEGGARLDGLGGASASDLSFRGQSVDIVPLGNGPFFHLPLTEETALTIIRETLEEHGLQSVTSTKSIVVPPRDSTSALWSFDLDISGASEPIYAEFLQQRDHESEHELRERDALALPPDARAAAIALRENLSEVYDESTGVVFYAGGDSFSSPEQNLIDQVNAFVEWLKTMGLI